jgi:hypothetical protein
MSVISPTIKLLLLSLLVVLCDVAHAESKSVSVHDPRPVAKAVELLEVVYGFPITYEDAPYVHESTIADITDQVHRDRPTSSRVLIPKGGTISFTYDIPTIAGPTSGGRREAAANLAGAAANAIGGVLRSDGAAHGGAMFSVIQSNGLFHVVPTRFIDASGRTEKTQPILDTPVSFVPKLKNGAGVVAEICQSLSLTTGQTVIIGTIPTSLLGTHTTAITATNEPARSVLDRLFKEMNVPLSWQLYYGPDWRSYALNIHMVVPANK